MAEVDGKALTLTAPFSASWTSYQTGLKIDEGATELSHHPTKTEFTPSCIIRSPKGCFGHLMPQQRLLLSHTACFTGWDCCLKTLCPVLVADSSFVPSQPKKGRKKWSMCKPAEAQQVIRILNYRCRFVFSFAIHPGIIIPVSVGMLAVVLRSVGGLRN